MEKVGYDLNPIINNFTESLEILNRIKDSHCFDVSKVRHQNKLACTNKNSNITKFKLFSEYHQSINRGYCGGENPYMFRGGEAKTFYFNKTKYYIMENCDVLYHHTPEYKWNGKVTQKKQLYINSDCPNFFALFNKSNEMLKSEILKLSNASWLNAEDMKKFPDWVKDYLILK